MTDKIVKKLDMLALYRTQLIENADNIDELITQAIAAAALTDDHDAFLTERLNLEHRAKALEAEVKKDVERHGASVKSAGLHAVYSLRSSWDSKGLKGYAVAHPELGAFLTEKPSVSIRTVKPPKEDNDVSPPKTESASPPVQSKKGPTLGNIVIEFARGLVGTQQAREDAAS